MRRTPLTQRGLMFAWLAAYLLLSAYILWRFDAWNLSRTVTESGISYINGFITVDHPFHTVRAWALIESLRHGEFLHWVSQHQGGYPVEFYPLGVAWVEAGIWALSLGTLSIVVVHKLTILLMFLLPGVGFWALCRGDRMSPAAGFIAFALHLSIGATIWMSNGRPDLYWMSGGYEELIGWGLVTNVAGAVCALITLGALSRFVLRNEHWMGLVAIGSITLATYANTRSLIAIGVIGIAVVMAIVLSAISREIDAFKALVRLGLVAGLSVLLTAPELLSLLRYSEFYYFVNYNAYNAQNTYWNASVAASTQPVIWLAVCGGVVAIVSRRYLIIRTAAFTCGLYVFATWLLSSDWGPQQLETPRLMPFQRLLLLFLAGFFVYWLASTLLRQFSEAREAVALVVGIAAFVMFVYPVGSLGADYQGLTDPQQVTTTDFDEFQQAVAAADAAAPEGTRILIIGAAGGGYSWHDGMWAPMATDKQIMYDHWLWGWNGEAAGPPALPDGGCAFVLSEGNNYPCPAEMLTESYLHDHAIGAIVLTQTWDDARGKATSNQLISSVLQTGKWDVYRVNNPLPLMTNGTFSPADMIIESDVIWGTFNDGSGDVLLRVSWHPRWVALANGKEVPIERGPGGYMLIEVPPGPVDLQVRYSSTSVDLLGGILQIVGLLGAIALVPTMRLRPSLISSHQ